MCVIWETECDFGYTKRRRIDEDDAEQEADDEEEVAEAFLAGENVWNMEMEKSKTLTGYEEEENNNDNNGDYEDNKLNSTRGTTTAASKLRELAARGFSCETERVSHRSTRKVQVGPGWFFR